MSLLWPGFLILLGVIPVLVAVYFWMLRRRKRFAVRYSSLALVRDILPRPSRLKRYLPFVLFVLASACLIVALSRPAAVVYVPNGQATIMLAVDVSRSMCTTDIPPNRMVAAQAAALSFIKHQKPNTQIGIVAFAGFAALVQPPTADPETLKTAIENLYTARRTAIGSGILKSIDAIAEINPNVAPSGIDPATGLEPAPVPEGAYVPDIIVVLTDGASNTGIHPLDAAQQAVDRGIRVYTIGYGTEFPENSWMDCSIQLQGDDPFGGGFDFGTGGGFGSGFGGGFRRGIDEETLKQIATLTGGKYYVATSASELEKVLISLPTYLVTKLEFMEISFGFAAVAALLMTIAVLFSLLWNPLP